MTILTACNRLANKCSIKLEDKYKPLTNLSSRDYPKSTTQISAFDVDEALNLIQRQKISYIIKMYIDIFLRKKNFI
jgi:hypothetical protein